jgi:hypothetical protein
MVLESNVYGVTDLSWLQAADGEGEEVRGDGDRLIEGECCPACVRVTLLV